MSEANPEDPYILGTIVKACDILGEVIGEAGECDPKIVILWETQQQYKYTREWLDQNVEIVK